MLLLKVLKNQLDLIKLWATALNYGTWGSVTHICISLLHQILVPDFQLFLYFTLFLLLEYSRAFDQFLYSKLLASSFLPWPGYISNGPQYLKGVFQNQMIAEEGSSRSFQLQFDLKCFEKSCLMQLYPHTTVKACLFFNFSCKNIICYNYLL